MDNFEVPAGALGDAAEAVARMLPFDMSGALNDLVSPVALARDLPWLTGELTKITFGQSDLWFGPRDKRFADEAWQQVPYFRMLGQSYRLFELWMDRLCENMTGSWEAKARARFAADVMTATLSPTNYLATNPAALRKAAETGGMSLLAGAQNILRDLARGGMPSAADRTSFKVGENLACTPGAVVYREEMFELLQYAPATPKVRTRPLVIVPPQVNRYYILDLAPGRSLVEFAVSQGVQVFMIVWRNPSAQRGHGQWGLEDYIAAQERAAGVVRAITRSRKLSWLGLCAGGMTTAFTLAHLAATGDDSASSATFLVTMLASKQPNVVGMLDTGGSRGQLSAAAQAGQVVPGSVLRGLFALLRPNDLVYNYLVNGWLMGQPPPPFDVLAWNDDATGTTVKFALDIARLVVDGWEEGGPVLLGVASDLGRVGCDSFHVAGSTDHITRWRACYSTTQLVGGEKELTLVKSGHIQSFVYPADETRYDCWYGPPATADPDEWLETAAVLHGSWWRRWAEWLVSRSGGERQARATLGNRGYPPLGPAPGTYVHE